MIQVILLIKVTLVMEDQKIIQYSNQFISILKFLVALIKLLDGNLKGCQKKKLLYIHNSKIAVKFEGNCLKQEEVSFTHGNVVNLFTV